MTGPTRAVLFVVRRLDSAVSTRFVEWACALSLAATVCTPRAVYSLPATSADTSYFDLRSPLGILTMVTGAHTSPGDSLSLVATAGSGVSISGWDRDSVAIVTTLTKTGCPEGDISAGRSGRTVFLSIARHRHSSDAAICWATMQVFVPRHSTIKVFSGSGPIQMDDLLGSVDADVTGGQMVVGHVNGTVRLIVQGGALRVHDSMLHGSIRSTGGAVILERVEGDVSATASGGSVVRR